MEGNRGKPRALLVFGAPGSGKTTFAEKFGKKFGLACYNFDELKNENNFTRKNILTILAEIIKTKQTIIIEGGINTGKERDEFNSILKKAGYEPALIWIQTDVATIRSRLKAKYKSVAKAKELYETAVSEIEAPADEERPIILSGKHTFDTQAKHVVLGLADLIEIK